MESNQKKTVGVITKHRVVNYGSFLQAYATQYVIEKLGYKCEIIDYQYPNAYHRYYLKNVNPIVKYAKLIARYILMPFRYKIEKQRRFYKTKSEMCKEYISNHILLSSKHYNTKEDLEKDQPIYDIYMTGSDQTWNPVHMKGDPIFMLSFAPKGAKKIAFSASMCSADIPKELKERYTKYLSQYSKISTRENASHKQIESLSGVTPTMTLDPTLLLNRDEWRTVFNTDKYKGSEYILFYPLYYSFEPRPYIFEIVEELQKQTGLKVLILGDIVDDCKERGFINVSNATIDDFISLFANANYVVTSSFHGTAFAVNFNIPLYSVVPKSSHDNRQSDFLKQVGCNDYIFPIGTPFRFIKEPLKCDRLVAVRNETIDILKDMLND